jgi:hypothetical protein
MAYRLRYHLKCKNTASFKELLGYLEELNRISEAHGITPGRIMTQSFGPFDEIAVDVDYPDLATYEREFQKFFSRPEVQDILTRSDPLFREFDSGGTVMWEDVSSQDFEGTES